MLTDRSLPVVLALFVTLSTASCGSGSATAAGGGAPASAPPVSASPGAQVPRSATLVLGSISSDPVDEVKEFQPFAEALAARLAPAGIKRVQVRVSASVGDMTRLVRAGEVDLYIDSPFAALTVARASGATLFLNRWKGGVANYRTVVFVRADSPIRTAADLAGKRVAFEDDASTSGYFLPRLALMDKGLRVVPLRNGAAPGPSDVSYDFSGDEKNTLFWMEKGRTEAGAMSEHDLAELTSDDPKAVRVVLTGPPVPRHLVLHRRDLEPARVDAVRTALLGLDDDAAGKAVLAEFAKTDRFEELSPGAVDKLKVLLARFSAGVQ